MSDETTVGGNLTQEAFDKAVEAVYRQPSEPPMLITTRHQKDRALDWRRQRANQLVRQGRPPMAAFRQADREAFGWFDPMGRFRGPDLTGEGKEA